MVSLAIDNKFPRCLNTGGLDAEMLDHWAYFFCTILFLQCMHSCLFSDPKGILLYPNQESFIVGYRHTNFLIQVTFIGIGLKSEMEYGSTNDYTLSGYRREFSKYYIVNCRKSDPNLVGRLLVWQCDVESLLLRILLFTLHLPWGESFSSEPRLGFEICCYTICRIRLV